MSKKLLINVMHPEEARVAIVQDGRLVELDIEVAGSEQTRGNVYKAVVVRVEPGLQAAFVDIGLKKLGFLQMGEIHPEVWQWRDDVPEEQRKRRPRIQEVLRRGQEVIVQVEKGERDMKGAALTSYLSLPGRYMVLMPGSDSAGISRKVENEADRKKLKEMAAQLDIPEGIGYIMRTEALGKTKTELNKDLKSLLKLHQEIVAKAAKAKAPALIYQEQDLVIRTIRDYFTADIDEVLVDSPEVYKQAKSFFKRTMPKFEELVKLHQEKRPIFSRYQLEEQIDQIHEKKVPLKSGGSLVIEPTEALVSIDVNSGKSTGEKGVEDTAYKTNMEAAEEAARQLRLRDLGGLIVIDFIDMRDKKHMSEVEKTLKNALKADKARVTVGRISQFGILEMSRQRIKPTLSEASYLECPHCEGRGKVKSVENMALSFLRKVHASAAKGTVAEVRGGLPLEVAYYLLNRKKRDLTQIEDDYEIEVTVKGKPSFLMNQLELDLVRREKPAGVEVSAEQAFETAIVSPASAEEGETLAAEAPAGEEAKGKKKRRRKRKGKGEPETLPMAEGIEGIEAPAEIPAAPFAVVEGVVAAEGEEAPVHVEEHKKKRRRRKRRGKGVTGEEAGAEAHAGEKLQVAASVEAGPATAPPSGAPVEAAPGEPQAEEHRKKKRRRKRRGAKPALAAEGAQEVAQEAMPSAEPASGVEPAPAAGDQTAGEAHGKKRRRRKRHGERHAPLEHAETGHVSPVPESMPVDQRGAGEQEKAEVQSPNRSRRKQRSVDSGSGEAASGAPAGGELLAPPVTLAAEPPTAQKKQAKRAKGLLPGAVANVSAEVLAEVAASAKPTRKKERTGKVAREEKGMAATDETKPARAPRRAKSPATETEQAAPKTTEVAPAEPGPRKRAPRKKKGEPAEPAEGA